MAEQTEISMAWSCVLLWSLLVAGSIAPPL